MLICGVRGLVGKAFSVSLCGFNVHGLSFLREVCGLLGENQSSFPFSLECS